MTVAPPQNKKLISRTRFKMGVIGGGVILLIIALFYASARLLSTPSHSPIGLDETLETAQQILNPDAPEDKIANADPEPLAHSYIEFESGFVSNLRDSRKLVMLEIALSVEASESDIDHYSEQMRTIRPALRSVILHFLANCTEAQASDTRHRDQLAEDMRHEINLYLKRFSDTGSQIAKIHITKMGLT